MNKPKCGHVGDERDFVCGDCYASLKEEGERLKEFVNTITVLEKEDGYWLTITLPSGATMSVKITKEGQIITGVIKEWAKWLGEAKAALEGRPQ